MTAAEVRLAGDGRALELVPADDGLEALERRLRMTPEPISTRRMGSRLKVDLGSAQALLDREDEFIWSAEAARVVANRRQVRDAAPRVLEAFRTIRLGGAEAARDALRGGTRLLDRLDDHQVINVAAMTVSGGWGACIFDEQGTGKTITAISAFDVLVERNEADVLLVVAPKSMVGEWAAEVRRFTGSLYSVAISQGSRSEKAQALACGADVVVVNYEGAITLRDDLRLLAQRCRVVLAIDESYNLKNPDALRTGAIAELREWCTRCFVLCGTPAPNSPDDLVQQVDLVDFGLTFERLSAGEDSSARRQQIHAAMDSRGIYSRNLKQDVLPDLPTRNFTEVSLELAQTQRWLYKSALGELVAEVSAASEHEFRRHIVSFMERRNALLRICSNPAPLVPDYDELPSKIQALDEILPQRLEAGEKVVLWSFYRASLDALDDRYSHLGLVRIDGSVTEVEARRDAIQRFQEDEAIRIFLGNPAAAGSGVTLHRARVAIYESMSNQAAHFMQSLDRIHRRGQERDVEYVVLLCRDTIERDEYARLLRKMEAQANVLGDPDPQQPTREVFLGELLAAQQRIGL